MLIAALFTIAKTWKQPKWPSIDEWINKTWYVHTHTHTHTHTHWNTAAATAAKLLQSCPTLCDPIDGSPPGSPVPGILQARTLEWVAISFSTGILLSHKKVKMPFAATWIWLEITILSEVSQRKTNIYHLHVESKLQHKWTYWNRSRIMDRANRLVAAKGEGVGGGME